MSRVLSVILCIVWGATAYAADGLARGMDAMRDGNWSAAQSEARTDGQEALDVILWHYFRAENGTAAEVIDFLRRRPDWPGLPYLKKQTEAAFADAPAALVREFFDEHTPRTGAGALASARAHVQSGNRGAAEAEVVLAWRTLSLSNSEHAAFLQDWGAVLQEHHIARLDHVIWQGWSQNARRMFPLVSEDWQASSEARLGLRAKVDGVDSLLENVPADFQNGAGLAYERFRWRYEKRRFKDAIDLMLERSKHSARLGRPEAWSRARRDLARRQMQDGNHALAYSISSTHHLQEGTDFADLEWLSGYLSLRFLGKPERALAHFKSFREEVETPISFGRAGYWMGRAYEAMGDAASARAAYEYGALWQTSFYGLLAAEKIGQAPNPALAGTEAFGPWRDADFTQSSVFRAAILLLSADELALGERWLTHLAESLPRTEIGKMGDMLGEMQQTHVQVMVGKRAARYGMEIPGPYYAVHPKVVATDYPVPKEMVLAIARRESEFDPGVISHAGAMGFMQLMPRTAEAVSGWLSVGYDKGRLLSDPAYNATLGAEYLAALAEDFNGNAVMMAAGYNAGPSRPTRWMELNGDPRRGGIDIVDWVEMIPFDETRNYVMRVTESLPVYRARLGLNPLPVPFSQELIGSTLSASRASKRP